MPRPTEGPKRLVWAREARTLLAFERRAAAQFDRTLLVSAQEAQTFAALAPEVASRIDWLENGVDLARFEPARRLAQSLRGTIACDRLHRHHGLPARMSKR